MRLPVQHILSVLPVLLLLAPPAAAQRLSQPAIVQQTIADTVTVEITYARPSARGRTLFGGVVTWDETWNPGADSATAVRLSHAMLVAGNRLEPGRYSIWMTPRPDGPWTVIFSSRGSVFHVPNPGEQHDALRLELPVREGPHMETMMFHFPEVRPDGATLVFHWGETVMEIPIRTAGR